MSTTEQTRQQDLKNLQGRSVILDVHAADSTNKKKELLPCVNLWKK